MNKQTGHFGPAPVDLFSRPELMLRMRDEFGWADGETYAPVARWKSPKAEFFRFAGSDGHDIVVKAGANWNSDHPRFLYGELRRLRELLSGLEVTVPAPLGWLDEPRLLAMEPVNGEQLLSEVISDSSHPLRRENVAGLLEIIRECARVLAAYHAAQPAPDHFDVETEVKSDLRRAARRALVSPNLAQGRCKELSVARGFGLSGNDFLVDRERLVLVDPHHLIRYYVVQRDLSAFTFEASLALRENQGGKRNTNLADLIRTTFVVAYEEASGRVAEIDRWALQLYEMSRISGMLYNMRRTRGLAAFVRGAVWGVAHRLPLGMRGGRLPSLDKLRTGR